MIIRLATKDDINDMLVAFQKHYNEVLLQDSISLNRAAEIFNASITEGLVIIARRTEDSEVLGAMIGGSMSNVWDYGISIHLLTSYVVPELRNGTTGGRLFKAWMDTAKNKVTDKVTGIVVHRRANGTNMNYEKRGFKQESTFFIMEV